MASLKELRAERLRKLEELKKLGFDPYPAHVERTHHVSQVVEGFDQYEGKDATVVGRITSIRKFGKIAFLVIKDESGSLQLFLGAETVEKMDPTKSQLGIEQLPLLDPGDFVEAT